MSCTVTLETSGHRFTVEGEESVLDGALRHGVGLPYGCRNGFCGACKGKVVAGSVHYDARPGSLSADDEAAGVALLCKARPDGDLVIAVDEVKVSSDSKPKPYTAKVVRMTRLAPDVMAIWLKLPEADRLPFFAGQYIDILLDDGRRRAFSLANAPHSDELLELHIRHVPHGDYTTFVFEGMKEKDILRIEGPLGSFYFREESPRPAIFMGGGTGFAPLKGMLEHLFAEGTTRPLHLFWGVRARADLYLDALPTGWALEHANFRYTPVLSQPAAEDGWSGATGWVHQAVAAAYPDLSGYDVYMSGPPAMIDAAKGLFLAHGLPREQLFSDAFEFAKD